MFQPGVEFPEAEVQVFEGSNEEPPAVDADTGVVVEVRVQDEHRVELPAVPQRSHQRWVVMQPESLAEPVDTCMGHVCGNANIITWCRRNESPDSEIILQPQIRCLACNNYT